MSEKGLDFNANKKRKQSDSSPPQMMPPHSPAMIPPPTPSNNQSNRSYVIPNNYSSNPVSMPMSPSIPSPSTLPPQNQMQVAMNSYQNFHIPPSRFDLAIAKAKLVDLVCGEKDLDKFCGKATGFVCQHLNLSIGGFYMNERQNLKDWTMYCAYPSLPVFSAHFHFDVGFHLLMQAAVEKRCFSVNSTTSNGELTFLFVPIPSDTGNSMGVMVLGTTLKAETDTQAYLSFLEQIRKPMANALASLRSMQQNLLLLERLDLLIRENEIFRQRNRFDKALVNILSSVTAADVSIICTDTRGTITYFSPGAQHLLGYQATEIVGVSTPLLLHAPKEIDERSKQIEAETGRKVGGFGVFVENPQRTGLEETRKWTYVKKDGTQLKVSLSVKPIYDDAARIIGYVGIAKEVPNLNANSNV